MNVFEIFNNKPLARTNLKKYSPVIETIGPDRNDPYEQGWRARPGYDFNPYAKDTAEYQKWEDGQAERQAQPNHYDESVNDDDLPDLEDVGEPVSSIMDAERRMAAGDRIFVAHEMDEEPFEIFNVDDLKGYTYDQMLAVPQGVAETGPAATAATQQGLNPTEVGIADMTDKHNARWNAINAQKAQQMFAKGLDPTKTADWDKFNQQGVAEGSVSGYKEIEFVCVNPKFPEATDPKLQKQMYLGLQKIPGVIPLLQNWSDMSEGQTSLTAIYKDRESRQQILALAKRLGVSIDLEQPVSHDYVDRAVRGEHEGQQGVAEAERNEMGTPAVQAALKNMAARHNKEQWSKEQLAALGRRLAAQDKKSVKEDATELNVGDDVIITGNVKFNGTTGMIVAFGRDKSFVVVNLYNHGKHSFHSSDVSANEYADSDAEEADMYDRDPDARDWASRQGGMEENQWHGDNNAWSDGKGQWSDGRGQWSESVDRDVTEYLSEMKSAGYDIK